MDYSTTSASEIVKHISTGELSAVDCTQQYLTQIEKQNESLNAFLIVEGEETLETASKIDEQIAAGKSPGPLAGLPIAIKDGICTTGLRTSAGSRMLENFEPPYDATVVERLRDAGAIVIGKTNMDEFAMGSSTENSYFGPTRNPWSSDRVPGGSSGGSAACVSADIAPAALGSDTGGSIRQPAAFCGITGLKPTYGRVSRFGLIAYASSLDQIGPMGRSAEDCARIMNVIGGHDPKDSTSANVESPDYLATLEEPLSGVRIGVCREHFNEGLDSEVESAVKEAIATLTALGAEIVDIHLPQTANAVPAYYVIAPCEASSNLARFDGVRYTMREPAENLEQMYCKTRAEGFGPEVKRRIMLGTFALSSGYYDAYYVNASKVRRLIKQDFDQAFESVDMILGPTTPTPAFKIGEHSQDPLAMYLADIYTVSANLAGIPGISIPCGFSNAGLPIGLQLQAAAFNEDILLRTAHQFQQQTDWHSRRPTQ
jgi:aspartyl-tRNA(Asn)/glutamyl-tRNA(Gln) amidotransferase subunit A